MTAPDLNELEALLAKATPGPWWQEPFGLIVSQNENESGKRAFIAAPTGDADAALIVAAVNALPALLAYVRELERERDDAMYDVGQAADKAALAMRERCAVACESVTWPDSATWAKDFAAAIRALEA